MKKILILLVAIGLVLALSACQDKDLGNGALPDSLEEILEKIYGHGSVGEDFLNNMLPGLYNTVITEDNMEYYLGKSGLDIKEAIASEHEMDTVAYSLVLVRVNKGADVEQIKKTIKDNVDPEKWLCVTVDPDNVLVDSIGDVIVLIMSDHFGQNLSDAFRALKQ